MSDNNLPNFAEIHRLLASLPGPDLEAATAAVQRERQLVKPPGALGRLEELAEWLATWQGRTPPRISHPRIAVFAGSHGITVHGVSAYPASVNAQMLATFLNGGAAINQLAGIADADLRVYDLDIDTPTADFTQGPAMSEEACVRAMSYGMMTVESGIDLLCLGEMGIGNTTSAAALCCALFGGSAADWVGPGTGVDPAGLARKITVVEAGLTANPEARQDPLQALRCVGGFELAAIAGAIMAARLGQIPVLLDGYTCTAAAAVLYRCDPHALDHCRVAHRSAEPGHGRLLQAIGQAALLDFGMRLGEGSGAALAIPLLKAALACHTGMSSFAEAGVAGAIS
jgi:nicotinate-nucleotide--dimethylbenzimidazole phosphoribosyltransferase